MKEFDRLGYHVGRRRAAPADFVVHGVREAWRDLDQHRGRHIPTRYLRGSMEQRAALVQGLMDSDGDVDAHGRYLFSTTDVELARGSARAVVRLGLRLPPVPEVSEP